MKKIVLLAACAGLAACARAPESIDGNQVYFAFDSAVISDKASAELKNQSLYLKQHPEQKVVLAGYCDDRGSVEYNRALGALRASNAAHVLIKDGIEPERITTTSYGKEEPQYAGTGEKVWSLTRNVTTTVVK